MEEHRSGCQKHSDAVWKRFIGACDYFFERKNKATSSQRSEEVENLSKKEDIIKRMAALKLPEPQTMRLPNKYVP